MALTASVKEELSRLDIKKSSVRKAEVSAMLRFAGGLHIISGRIVIEAEVDLASTARRLASGYGLPGLRQRLRVTLIEAGNYLSTRLKGRTLAEATAEVRTELRTRRAALDTAACRQ